MAIASIIEHSTPAPLMALSVVDSLRRALRTNGEFPPPIGEVRCELVAQTAPVALSFDPPRSLYTFRNHSGYLIVDGTYTSRGDSVRRWPLGPGTYRIRVVGDYYQNAEFLLQWPLSAGARRIGVPSPQPNDPGSVALLPAASYPVPDVSGNRFQLGPTILRGTAFGADGTALAGIRAEVVNLPPFQTPANLPPLGDWPFLGANTDARGDWTLVLPDRRYFDNTPEIAPQPVTMPISVRVQYPTGVVVRQRTVTLGREVAFQNTALRGQVLGKGGRPLARAVLSTSVNALASSSRADGAWRIYFNLNQPAVPNVTVTATAPSGATATAAVPLRSEATVVVPTFNFP